MIFRLKYIVGVIAFALVAWLGFTTYGYFFDSTKPYIMIRGLDDGGYYANDIQCYVSSSKTGEMSLWLDGSPLIESFKLHARESDHPFTISTKTIANGEHTLKIELTDTTFRKNTARVERNFLVDNVPLQAAFVKPDVGYKVFQGRTLHVQFQVNKEVKDAKIKALAHDYPCFPESKNSSVYEAYIPIACEEMPNEYLLSVEATDHVGNTINLDNKFQIVVYPFKKSTLQVSKEKVEEEKELGASKLDFERKMERLSLHSPGEKLWRGAFCTPIDVQRVTTEFGTVRTTQEKGRYMHKALDVVNAPRSVVWSTQDGIVVLKERFADSGNTVVVDHGFGILSMFFHLEDFADIEVGQKIAKGNPVGTLGKTGYAKGYHLHWEMRVNNVAIDPMQWTKTIF